MGLRFGTSRAKRQDRGCPQRGLHQHRLQRNSRSAPRAFGRGFGRQQKGRGKHALSSSLSDIRETKVNGITLRVPAIVEDGWCVWILSRASGKKGWIVLEAATRASALDLLREQDRRSAHHRYSPIRRDDRAGCRGRFPHFAPWSSGDL